MNKQKFENEDGERSESTDRYRVGTPSVQVYFLAYSIKLLTLRESRRTNVVK